MHINAQMQMNAENMLFLKYKKLITFYYKMFKKQIDKECITYFRKDKYNSRLYVLYFR